MRPQLLDIEYREVRSVRKPSLQPTATDRKSVRDRWCRTAGDGSSCITVREFERDHTGGLQQNLYALNEGQQIGHMRQHVVAEQQIRGISFRFQLTSGFRTKENVFRRNPFLSRNFRNIARRFDTQNGNASIAKVLQKVAVIAGNLDNLRLRRQIRTVRSSALGVLRACSSHAWNRRKSKRNQKRYVAGFRTLPIAPTDIDRTRTRAVDKTAPSLSASQALYKNWPAATCRDRRTYKSTDLHRICRNT